MAWLAGQPPAAEWDAVLAGPVAAAGEVLMAVRLTVNGEPREVPDGATVDVVVARSPARPRRGVAAAVNGEVVPRRSWAGAALRDGDQVEVVTAVQGG